MNYTDAEAADGKDMASYIFPESGHEFVTDPAFFCNRSRWCYQSWAGAYRVLSSR